MNKGFTLIEAMITVSLLGALAAASFGFYEETRVAAAAAEARRALVREAELATFVLGRELRGAREVRAGAPIVLVDGDGAERPLPVDAAGLAVGGPTPLRIAGVTQLRVEPAPGGHQVTLELRARSPLLEKRARVTRRFFVGRRL